MINTNNINTQKSNQFMMKLNKKSKSMRKKYIIIIIIIIIIKKFMKRNLLNTKKRKKRSMTLNMTIMNLKDIMKKRVKN
jgi:hypothetical protein